MRRKYPVLLVQGIFKVYSAFTNDMKYDMVTKNWHSNERSADKKERYR